jgi:riboflavin kinase/FMN adenylyltransferase
MRTLVRIEDFHALPAPVTLATGFFDGVHRGHQLVLASAVGQARENGGQAWAMTFDQHPRVVLAPDRRPPLLTPLTMRLELLAAAGLDGCLVLTFTPELAALDPAAFVERLCGGRRAIAAIHCGSNWRFGARAAGNPEILTRLGERHGFRVVVVPPAMLDGHAISSTRIRKAIQEGRVEAAREMLGRDYVIREKVVRGRGRGRSIGMATANLNPAAEVLPAVGVYVVRTWIGDRPVGGVADLGWRPTFPDARPPAPILEIHFLDFEGDLYGATLDIAFVARIRDEIRFPDVSSLLARVAEDIALARRILARAGGGPLRRRERPDA